jgi:hypothetical protein
MYCDARKTIVLKKVRASCVWSAKDRSRKVGVIDVETRHCLVFMEYRFFGDKIVVPALSRIA